MAELPISAEQYFRDFSFDARELTIERGGQSVCVINVLDNEHKGEKCLETLYGCDIQPGDRLTNPFGFYVVRRLEVDTYHGTPALIRVFF